MKLLVIAIGALAITACATTNTTQLSENTYHIEMRGKTFADGIETSDQAYLTSAETTIDAGHRYFLVQSVDDSFKTKDVVRPGVYRKSLKVFAVNTGETKYPTGPEAKLHFPSQVSSVQNPGLDAVIETYAHRPSVDAVDAYEIVTLLGLRLNPDRWTPEAIEGLGRQ